MIREFNYFCPETYISPLVFNPLKPNGNYIYQSL
jgi:hypothetical protein